MLDAKLTVVGGSAKKAEIQFQDPMLVGRGAGCSLPIRHKLVSRKHCEIFEQNGFIFVRDLDSLNGTFVDSERIQGTKVLKPNQLLTIGNITLRAIYEPGDQIAPENIPSPLNETNEVNSAAEQTIELEQMKKATVYAPENPPEINDLPLNELASVEGDNFESNPNDQEQKSAIIASFEFDEALPDESAPLFTESCEPVTDEPVKENSGSSTDKSVIDAPLVAEAVNKQTEHEISQSEILAVGENSPAAEVSDVDIHTELEPAKRTVSEQSLLDVDFFSEDKKPSEGQDSRLGSFIKNFPR